MGFANVGQISISYEEGKIMKKFITIVLLFFMAKASIAYEIDFAICAMFKDEALFLKEWVEFHRLIGAKRFYLYNNLSSDNYKEVLEPYIKDNIVVLIDWPVNSNDWLWLQNACYENTLQLTRGKVKWVAFLDLDEFLYSPMSKSLPNLLKDYDQFGGVCVNWQIYGTSNVYQIPKDGLQSEYLIYKALPTYGANYSIKSIVQPDRTADCKNGPHCFSYYTPYYQVNTNKEKFDGPLSPKVLIDKIRINHYWTRDIKYFTEIKIARRQKLGWGGLDQLIEETKSYNAVKDDSIKIFLPELKQKMHVQ